MTHLLLLLFLAADLPNFNQFKVADTYNGKPAAPVIKTAADREFRTRIREAAADGPNFAGHFTVADWGCGAGCVSFVLIDAASGAIYNAPFKVLGWKSAMYEGKISSDGEIFEPIDFRKDSRLLVARGCPEEKDCGSYFWEWTGSQFKLLTKVPATPAAK